MLVRGQQLTTSVGQEAQSDARWAREHIQQQQPPSEHYSEPSTGSAMPSVGACMLREHPQHLRRQV